MSCIPPKTARLVQALLLAGLVSASVAAPKAGAPRSYIVQLKEAPAATYAGEVAGYVATQVPEGERLDANSEPVKAWRGHLAGQRAKVLASLGGKFKLLHQYDLTFNGFAATLTEAQVAKLRASGLVANVLPDEQREALTISTPHFLGLDGPSGVWAKKVKGAHVNGEGVIIAVIDSGIQPENPAFYDHVDANGTPVKTGGTLAYDPLPSGRYKGTCTTGPGFPADSCNNKLIGAQVFSAGYQAVAAAGNIQPFYDFYDVPRDEVGHGSHTLSTAGGNANAPAYTSSGYAVGVTSGMAPRARLATYKALFGTISNGSLGGNGYNSDLVAAIDKAVADGVDIINYSISGSQTNLLDPVEQAFLNASNAGVFVSASAGNSGPGNQVAHNSPWVTTVAASTHDRQYIADLSLGDGSGPYTGASFDLSALPAAKMVLSSDIPAAGVPVANANLCYLNSLDSTKAVGKIVVCDRGNNDRVEKSQEVARVGGVGMVLINPTPNNVKADFHSVPTVHLDSGARTAVRNYVANSGANATGAISARYQAPNVIAPVMASFSSRGPNLAEPSVMKPDITAPGVDVIASVTYAQQSQADHDAILAGTLVPSPVVESYQGTSMSSPHIAGIAALIKQAHPNWSPAAIKSALITSATGVKLSSGEADTDANGYGAGHVNPAGALNPGLIYGANAKDYVRFMCGANWLASDDDKCVSDGEMVPTNLNLPTFAVDVPGSLTIKRRVRNVGKSSAVYSSSVNVPGFIATVSPATLSLAKGEKAEFTLTLKSSGATMDTGVYGSLTWTDGTHVVRSPVLARARLLGAPAMLSSSKADGKSKFNVSYGFAGATSALVSGLKAASRATGTVGQGGTTCFDLSVPANALVVRAALYNSDTSGNGGDDLDLTLVAPNGASVAYSGGSSSNEVVGITAPSAGTYKACVYGYAPAGGGASNFTLSSWVISSADAGGSLKVTGVPSDVAVGDVAKVKASWSGLAAGRYLGAIGYLNGDGTTVGTTLLSVEPGMSVVTATASNGPTAQKAKLMARR